MKNITFIAVAVCVLAGCAGPASQVVIGERTQANKAQIEKLITPPAVARESSPVAYSDRSWIPLRRVDTAPRDLGRELTDAMQIEVNQQFGNLNEIAGTVTSLSGMPVVVGSDVLSPGGQTAAAGPNGSGPAPIPPGAPLGIRPPGGGPLPPGFGTPLNALSPAPSGPITPNSPFTAIYSGSLSGFMNLVAAYYGVYWKTNGGTLRFFLLDSRTFRIAALPGDTRLSSSVDSGANTVAGASSGGGASAGGATPTQAASTANSTGVGFAGLSVWTAIESSIKQMLGPNGKVVASPATGTITVTDTPVVLDRVTEYVAEQNKALNRQVSVNVRVLSVELNEGETYGIQWDAVYRNLAAANPYAIGFKTAATTAEGVGNLILSAPTTSGSRWAGTSAMISALSTQGRVTELTSATVVTLNNQPVPVNVGRRVSYLASSSTSQTPNVGSTTSLTPGTVSTGFSMTLVPHIVDGKELLLQYSVDLSSLLRMKTISSGGNTIEAPDVSTSSFIQRVRLASNETLVVAGFDQDNLSAVAEGLGHAENTLMGNRGGTAKRTMLVILIQPTLAL
jgi:type IVB pilus formation R64 PilN family outer membrane protein